MKNVLARAATIALTFSLITPVPVPAAEATTGAIVVIVTGPQNAPIANARVDAVSASGRYGGVTDVRGRYTQLGVVPDTYVVSVSAPGFARAAHEGVVVFAGSTQAIAFALSPVMKTIATVRSTVKTFTLGSTTDTFTVSGDAARASDPTATSSGQANYLQGTVQGAIASVPGVDEDAFANAILRGGKIQDAVFDFDSVPIPQGLVAEPGGNITGAQLFTAGIGSTTTTLAGFEAEGQNALGGVVDEIPAIGQYPGSTTLDVSAGLGALNNGAAFQTLGATADLRWRYAFAATAQSEYLPYGNGTSYYPGEAGAYGLSLQSRGETALSGNLHFQLTPSDDLAFAGLFGEANYDQYDTPFSGETNGFLNGAVTPFPGVTNQNAAVDTPARVRGTYDVLKLQWVHTSAHSSARLQLYQSQFGSVSGGAWWDDNGFPDGNISLFARQGGRLSGGSYDVDDIASDRHHIKYGVQYTSDNSFLYQVVPTADEYVSSNPTIFTTLGYLGDTWTIAPRFDVTGTLRATFTHIVPSNGSIYDDNFVDPHVSAAYRIGSTYAVRATFDHTSVAPLPLEADRTDTANPAPFVTLAPETADNFSYSFEGGGKTQLRLTYYADREAHRLDVLPFNFRNAVEAGQNPIGVGVPTNAGELRAHGFEAWIKYGGLTFDANYVRAYSSSAAQFALNDLNAAAIAGGHLFPVGYVPDFSAVVSYEASIAHRRIRITPTLSYESGYPYGNGRMVWVFNSKGQPVEVPNDNHLNPGYNYYFLANPACPLNELPDHANGACAPGTNPYIGTMGTNEGADPNSLRTTPQLLTSIHAEGDVSKTVTASIDVTNVFGVSTPVQLMGNPYLIGPPGYEGGNPYYSAWYAQQVCPDACPRGAAYPYGNGISTNYFPSTSKGANPIRPAVPWNYGTAGYVGLGWPMARTILFRLRLKL